LHAAPDESQRAHWKEYLTPLPDQDPAVPESVWPTWAVPAIEGELVLVGLF
jgi:hypothetical protein